MRGHRRGGGGNDRGAVLVEFALVLPVLVCVLLGTITGGFALAKKNSMANAIREATRLGATLPFATTWEDWAVDVRDRAVGLSGGDLTNTQVCVEIHRKTAGGSTELGDWPDGACPFAGTPAVPPSTPNDECLVLVWAHRTAPLNAFFFSWSLDLDAPAIARYERDCRP